MIDPITKALQDVFFEIPREILEATFKPAIRSKTLDACIMDDLIRGKVLTDCNIYGGKLVKIPMTLDNAICLDAPVPYTLGVAATWSTYRIHPRARENRPIAATIAIRFPYNYTSAYQATGCNPTSGITLSQLACSALNAMTFQNAITTPTPVLLSGDTIRLDPPQLSHMDWILECRLCFDQDFTNMDVNSLQTFGNLVMAATKAYIYNQMIITVDRTYLSGGQELGIFKQLVESYADQADKYKEHLVEFAGVGLMDPDRINRIVTAWL